MTTDIEKELRELFREKATDAPAAVPSTADAPQEVLRRGRIHQIGTVVGSAVVAFALVVGSVAGLRALVRGGDTVGGPDDYEVFERTATIEAFTVTSPSDWFLVNQWPRSMQLAVGGGTDAVTCIDPATGEIIDPLDKCGTSGSVAYADAGSCTIDPSGNQTCSGDAEPVDPIHPQSYGLPMLQLSNLDLGLDYVACRDGLPSDAAVLYVGYIQSGIDPVAPNLNPFPPGSGVPEPTQGPCGRGSYAEFTVNGHSMFAWVGVGADVSEADRATVGASYEMLSADDTWEPSGSAVTTPAYVLAGGTSRSDETWRLELRPSAQNVELSLPGLEPGVEDFTFGADEPVIWCCAHDEGLSVVTFGAVVKGATGIEFRPSEGDPIPGRIVPLPPSMPFDFDLFFIEGTGGLLGEVVPIRPADAPTLSPPPVVEPRAEAVELNGSYDDHDWTARFTGSFAEDTACMQVSLGDEHLERICPSPTNETVAGRLPYLNGWLTSFYLLAGSVPPEVEEIRFVSGNAVVRSQLRCAMGPLGWTNPDRKVCALALPQEGAGTLQYLDAAGTVVFEENIGWSRAEPDVPSEWAVAAGTICGERWSLTRVRSEQGFGLRLDWGTGEMVSAGMSVLGDDALPPHWVPLSGCPDPTDTPSAPEWIVWGLVSRRADAVWLLTDSGKSVEASLATESSEGPFVFWTILNDETLQDELNAAPVGEIVAFDDCEVIGRGSFSTEQQPLPSPAPSIDVAECMPQP